MQLPTAPDWVDISDRLVSIATCLTTGLTQSTLSSLLSPFATVTGTTKESGSSTVPSDFVRSFQPLRLPVLT